MKKSLGVKGAYNSYLNTLNSSFKYVFNNPIPSSLFLKDSTQIVEDISLCDI